MRMKAFLIFLMAMFVVVNIAQARSRCPFLNEAREAIVQRLKGDSNVLVAEADVKFREEIYYHKSKHIVFIPAELYMKNGTKIDFFTVVYYNDEKWNINDYANLDILIKSYPDARDQLLAAGYF